MRRTLCALILLATQSSSLCAAAFYLGVLHGDEEVYKYEISVIRLALEYAPGDHTLELVPMVDTSQDRVFRLMESEESEVNVFFSGYSPRRKARFLQVDVPLTRGLLGYRLLVAREDRLPEFAHVNTLEDLQSYSIGSGIGWPDNDYLEANGLEVVASQYANLWRMLQKNRFDLFHRGIQEVFEELRRPEAEGLAVVPGIVLAFRFDYFIYVNARRQDLHDILEEGLQRAFDSGALTRNFNNSPRIKEALRDSHLDQRTVIPLQLPQAYRTLDEIPAKYWYTPAAIQEEK
eukprot:TRINITY_DN4580_c0_g1_i1.p1 TRINITY_DN4580_c0_g1~~TRINITY_DN4580_c0_g1_i1.p1  ORF type:complete len:290 (-),score=18.98 TRINITY_DN4580_c0_g1_i1:127-996(-)